MSYKHPSGEEFGGVIGRTVAESKPWWPEPNLPKGAPNVVIVVLDDSGFAHFGCYGSTIETPNIDRLAAGGLRFTGFHTTALCSPSRAYTLAGRIITRSGCALSLQHGHRVYQIRAASPCDFSASHQGSL